MSGGHFLIVQTTPTPNGNTCFNGLRTNSGVSKKQLENPCNNCCSERGLKTCCGAISNYATHTKLGAAYGLSFLAFCYLFERAIRALFRFVRLSLFCGFEEAFVLRRIIWF